METEKGSPGYPETVIVGLIYPVSISVLVASIIHYTCEP
jgi:hypothetical protein